MTADNPCIFNNRSNRIIALLIFISGFLLGISSFHPAIAKVSDVKIISVYDNYQVNQELKTDWGFSCVIQLPTETILFDTGGDSSILLSNMQKMDVQPKSIEKVFISHIHGDHIGGLKGFLTKNSNVTVFIPDSLPDSVERMVSRSGAQAVKIPGAKKISDYVYTSGPLYGPPTEQSLIIDHVKGLVIITGCAHPGITRIVKKAMNLMKRDKVHLVMGGFHHPPVTVVQKFRSLRVTKVAPSHCTGDTVRKALAEEYKRNFIENGVGRIIRLE